MTFRILLPMLILGALLRFWLAFDVFLNQGFFWDMVTFANWQEAIREHGYEAYRVSPGINYPSVFAWVLVAINSLGDLLAPILGISEESARWSLQKLPPILADLAIAWSIALIGKKWFTEKVGLIGAGLYLFLPVTWYDSAIWGQMDSLAALPMLWAVYFVIDRKPELAALALVLAVLTKPQGVLVLLILLPVFIGQLIKRDLQLRRIASTLIAGLATFAILAAPWSFESYVPGDGADIPILGDLLGLAYQYFSTAGLFPVLTANAYNIWALVGNIPLSEQINTGIVYWITDNYEVFGIPAAVIGITLFLAVCALIFVCLIKRHNPTQVLTAFSLLLVAFFVLPTRVHERYLAQAFAVLCVVWAVRWYQRISVTVLTIASTVNMHAILAMNLSVNTAVIQPSAQALSSSPGTIEFSEKVLPILLVNPDDYGFSWVRMDALWARQEWVVVLVVWIHVFALAILLFEYLKMNRKERR